MQFYALKLRNGLMISCSMYMSVPEFPDAVPLDDIKNLPADHVAVNRRIMQKQPNRQASLFRRLQGHFQPSRFPQNDLVAVARVIKPTASSG